MPSDSFFEFCTVLLDKYENNNSISIISGLNHLGEYKNGKDYLFTKNISIWGWASWSRVVNNWDASYSEFKKIGPKRFRKKYRSVYPSKILANTIQQHINSGKEHYESILIYNHLINNQLAIVPTKNLIRNIGNDTEGGTHSASSLEMLPNSIKKVLTLKTHELQISKFNDDIKDDKHYSKKVYKIMAWDHPIIVFNRRIEVALKKLFRSLFRKK